ncbi:hypothetical protein RO3G_05008 [Rhizopus delemar RA 99-880]|uniref:Uncharacterized protein n=1 Tax=Rhizopus delemar (strain RA 99-880 / ATCC MYA-4621 / FGSC 9543 / NRRL 43880) TaxID=246409 RepID=I1BVS3_RHIO9|nr:hypothetical protein RO3G_05008 [Rhizopus delemar RA 99-880]|eukprot:EIE80303.1 hypothetical protein RO3G_05008 [Rhizopus delemar RA 99-880]
MNKNSCIQEKLFGHTSKLLLKKDLDTQEDMISKYDYLRKGVNILVRSIVSLVRLSLSSIINMLQPCAYEALKKIFNKKEMETLESAEPSIYIGLSEEDKTLLKKIVKSGSKMSNTDNMIDEILSEQLRLSNLRIKFSDTYRMLDILRYISLLRYEGYLYSLEKKEGVAVAILVEELVLPTKKSEAEHVFQTINTLLY